MKNREHIRTFLAALLTFCMLSTLLPAPALADESSATSDEATSVADNYGTLYVEGFNGSKIEVTTLDGDSILNVSDASKGQVSLNAEEPYLIHWTLPLETGYLVEYDGSLQSVSSDQTLSVQVPAGKDVYFRLLLTTPRPQEPHMVVVLTNTSLAGSASSSQTTAYAGDTVQLTAEANSGFQFIEWIVSAGGVDIAADGSFTMPDEDVVVTAEFGISEDTDTDEDGVPDYLEALFETDPTLADTDGDGLTDYQEINILQTDPTLPDTDGNGILDGDEDADGDGLTNIKELELGTDPLDPDSDSDGLTDGDEVLLYHTDPLSPDSDNDGLKDALEFEYNMDPTNPDTLGDGVLDGQRVFTVTKEYKEPSAGGLVRPSIEVSIPGAEIESLAIEAVPETDPFLSDEIPGFIDNAFDFQVDGDIGEATLSFEFDASLLNDPEFQPAIYYWNEELQLLEELPNQTVSGNVVSATVEHFSKYILLNAKIYNDVWSYTLQWDDGTLPSYQYIDIAFVIDSSSSMYTNDRQNVRITVTKNFVDKLNENDRAAIIDFDNSATTLSDFTSDKEILYAAADRINSGGGTDLSVGISTALNLFEADSGNRPDTLKYIIMLTDGEGSYSSSYTTQAAEAGIVIHTVGLGNGISTTVLTEMAKGTGGKYYPAAQADQLYDIFDNIADTSDLRKDTDKDGINDYYEKELAAGHLRLGSGVPLTGVDYQNPDSDGDGLKDGEEITVTKVGNKIFIRMTSNPTLSDSDFDGINDFNDLKPLSNEFEGKFHYIDFITEGPLVSKQNIKFSIDFSSLFADNDKYKDDLAVWGSLLASEVYDNTYVEVTHGALGGSDDATAFVKLFGLSDVEDIEINGNDYVDDKDDVTEFIIGHRNVEYMGDQREIIIVAVRGTNGTNAEWSSNFDVGADTDAYYAATGLSHTYWMDHENHKGFDVAANRVLDKINDYLVRHSLNNSSEKSIFITGHSRGAAVANILGKHFEENSNFTSFTYTYATPNTTTAKEIAANYKTIFNLVNKDDIIPRMPLDHWGFTKYGTSKSVSVKENYEDKLGTSKEGTWDWLMGKDYNNDGGTQRTLDSFAALANDRSEIYELDTSKDGTVLENNVLFDDYGNAQKELKRLSNTLEEEKLLKFCKLNIVGNLIYRVEVNYSPAYLMQILANMTTSVGPRLGRDVKGKYVAAKRSFVFSSGKLIVVGGMGDPHEKITYYLIAYRGFE